MPQLAINGGAPIRDEASWPGWPIHDEREEELILEVTRSGIWSFEGPKEAEFCERFAEFNNARPGDHPGSSVRAWGWPSKKSRGQAPA